MPEASTLTDDEQARVNGGFCACGCGDELPREQHWDWRTHSNTDGEFARSGVRWALPRCRQRAYRRRLKEGRVVTAEARRKKAELAQVAELERAADWEDRKAAMANAEAKRLRKQAETFRARWSGQMSIGDAA